MGDNEVGREGTYLKVMGKLSVLMWNNRKSQRTIGYATGCSLPYFSINQVQEVITKFYRMFADFSMTQTGYTPAQK